MKNCFNLLKFAYIKDIDFKDQAGNVEFVFDIGQPNKTVMTKVKVLQKSKLAAINHIKNKYPNCQFYHIYRYVAKLDMDTKKFVRDQVGQIKRELRKYK